MKLALASTLLLPSMAKAAYPGELTFSSTNCDAGALCATLEFCNSGTSYGYRRPGDSTPCGTTPGPLIRMSPGKTYKLTLQNTVPDSSVKTNVHTHGLHIVGDGDGDDVTRFVEGGSCLDYTWDIPSDHPGGTYWYHPHYHTLTNVQTSGGAFGMLIIDDDYNQLNSWAHRENEKLLQISTTDGTQGNGSDSEGEYNTFFYMISSVNH